MDTHNPDSQDPDAVTMQRELAAAQHRIAELTAELDATNRGIIALHLELDNARESEAQARAEHEVLADRERIAHDLHEQVIRRLLGTALDLEGTTHLVQRPQTADRIRRAVEDIDAAVRQLRGTIFDLHIPQRTTGFHSRLVDVVSQSHALLGFIPSVSLEGGAPVDAVPPDTAAHALAAIERTLTVIAQHHQATSADITVSAADGLLVTITHDGPRSSRSDAPAPAEGMDELDQRAQALGGSFRALPTAGGRHQLEWHVPLPTPSPARAQDI
jgi:signal transduction histidine kinase